MYKEEQEGRRKKLLMNKAWRGVKSLQVTKVKKVIGQVGENF